MPLKQCSEDGNPGWKWGDEGKCFTYEADSPGGSAVAKAKALKQASAINISNENRDKGQVQI